MDHEEDSPPEDLRVVTAPPEAAGERIDRWLATVFEALSRSRLKHLIENGRVWRDDQREVDASAKVRAGSVYRIGIPAPVSAEPEAEDIPLSVLYEDAHLIVIDKPAGLSVHPAPGNWTGTLVNAVLHHAGASLRVVGATGRPGIVHRLDKDTSGVMVVCKSEFAMTSLGKQFANRTVDRLYRAFTVGCPKPRQGRIEARLARDSNDRKKMAVVREDATVGKTAATNYVVERIFGPGPDAAEVRCKLETGRTHQIRVHMAHIGTPLIGDQTYGGNRASRHLDAALDSLGPEASPRFSRQALHAATLAFTHPATDERLSFETPLPRDMEDLSRALALLSPSIRRT